MLSHIPTHLIAGPLGAGKTSLIRQLLLQKPAAERWAVLINEFGQIGLDAALLTTDAQGIGLAEVPGGCLCCVNGAPFQVGLARLLRQSRPDRLLIEPSGLGHPLELLRQLGEVPWQGVLALQPPVMVLDAAALAAGATLPELPEATGLLVLNKAETLDPATRRVLAARLPSLSLLWTSQGQMDFAQLPGHSVQAGAATAELNLAASSAPAGSLWLEPGRPICQVQQQAEGWSIGWRWHPSQRFELMRVQHWLASLPWQRAKLVLQTNAGWLSANALDGAALHWQNSEWRKDSRLELIFATAQDEESLRRGMDACRLS